MYAAKGYRTTDELIVNYSEGNKRGRGFSLAPIFERCRLVDYMRLGNPLAASSMSRSRPVVSLIRSFCVWEKAVALS